ncbi:MAG: Gfo/Idh/MocA family oxidoreductase [Planctomycetes bacterium]|nr:Gfo/Idh/MocA family oxidoreductase [Planctomycetota bacterium]
MEGRVLRAGVVGVGHLGKEHARVWRSLDGIELVGVSDRDPTRVAAVAEPLGVPAFPSVDALAAEGIDVASVATTTDAHAEVAMALIARGTSVLVEKPMAKTLDEADRMIEAAKARGVAIGVGHIERFNPVVLAARPFLTDPVHIECDRVAPFSFRSMDVGVVFDLMIHDIDLVLDIVGSPVESIEALGAGVLTGSEDLALAWIRFANGCHALAKASRVALDRSRKMRIFCRDAYISLDFVARRGFRIAVRPGVDLGRFGGEAAAETDFRSLLDIQPLAIGDEEPLRAELAAFAAAVRDGAAPPVSGRQGRDAMACAIRIQEAIARNRDRLRAT